MFTILLAAYTVTYSHPAIVLSPWSINLSNGELDQAQFLERDQGHVMEKVARGGEVKREREGDRNGDERMK